MLPGRHGRGNIVLKEDFERELGLGNELVPHEVWECAGHTCKNRDKLGFEILDCTFLSVVAVHVRGGSRKVAFHFSSI